jgi:hypothetical protein
MMRSAVMKQKQHVAPQAILQDWQKGRTLRRGSHLLPSNFQRDPASLATVSAISAAVNAGAAPPRLRGLLGGDGDGEDVRWDKDTDVMSEEKHEFVDISRLKTGCLVLLPRYFKLWRDGKVVFAPDSPFMFYWNIVTMLVVFYSAFITPCRIGFLTKPGVFTAVIDVLIDICFMTDIVLSFHCGFVDRDTGENILDTTKIRNRYMRTWLLTDCISSFPIAILMQIAPGSFLRVQVIPPSTPLAPPLSLSPPLYPSSRPPLIPPLAPPSP